VKVNCPAGQTVLTTCPAGHTLLVKSAYLFNGGAAASAGNMIASDPQVGQVYFVVQTLQPNTTFAWQGWLVLEEGQQLSVITSAAGISVWLSGSVLTGVPIPTPARDIGLVTPLPTGYAF
jgi:hypothetical protein